MPFLDHKYFNVYVSVSSIFFYLIISYQFLILFCDVFVKIAVERQSDDHSMQYSHHFARVI